MKKLLYGVGINDADYTVRQAETRYVNGKRRNKHLWTCPFYSKWAGMLARGYSIKLQAKNPTYAGCTVCEEWLTFSNFKAWMETQDWEGKQLDKDLLIIGNKLYSPSTCVFISKRLNVFLIGCDSARGLYPIGVSWAGHANKFRAQCGNPMTGIKEKLGYFDCPNLAHQAWRKRKLELSIELAKAETDPRVLEALVERYSATETENGKLFKSKYV